jgi:hypothetical protein
MRKIVAIVALALMITVGAPMMAVGAAQTLNITMGPVATSGTARWVPAECAGLTDTQVDLCAMALTVPAESYDIDGARIDVPSGVVLVDECRVSYTDDTELTVCLAAIAAATETE